LFGMNDRLLIMVPLKNSISIQATINALEKS
jgi:hypothetical protein